jgi:hypothetical protein
MSDDIEMHLPNRWLAMDFLYGSAIPTFGRHVTILYLKSSVFLDTALSSLLKVNRCLGGSCHLHLQDPRRGWTRSQRESRCWGKANRLHGIIFTVLETSDPTQTCAFQNCFVWDIVPLNGMPNFAYVHTCWNSIWSLFEASSEAALF